MKSQASLFPSKIFALLLFAVACLLPTAASAQNHLNSLWSYSAPFQIQSVAYSPNGELIAVGSSSGVQIFSSSTGELVETLPATLANFSSVAFSPDGKSLAIGGAGVNSRFAQIGVLQIWNVSGGKLASSFDTVANQGVNALAFSPDGTTLADSGQATNGSGTSTALEIWNVASRKLTAKLLTSLQVGAVAFSEDGKTFADLGTPGNNEPGDLEFWDVSNYKRRASLDTEIAGPFNGNSLASSPTANIFAVSGPSETTAGFGVQICDANTGKLTSRLVSTNISYGIEGCNPTAFSPDGKTVSVLGQAFTTGNSVLDSWTVSSGNPTTTIGTGKLNSAGFAYSPGGNDIVVAGVSYGEILNASTGSLIAPLITPSFSTAAYSPTGGTIAVAGTYVSGEAGGNGALEQWNTSTENIDTTFETAVGYPNTVVFSPNSKEIALGGFNRTSTPGLTNGILELLDALSGNVLATPDTSANFSVNAAAFSPDGTLLAVGGQSYNSTTKTLSGVLELWSTSTDKRIAAFKSTAANCTVVAFSPNGKLLAANAGEDVVLWDVSTGKAFGTLKTGAAAGINSFAFSKDGTRLAVGGQNSGATLGVLGVWDVSSGQLLTNPALVPETLSISAVFFSPDTKILFAESRVNNPSFGPLPILQAFSTAGYAALPDFKKGGSCISPDGSGILVCSQGFGVFANPYYSPLKTTRLDLSADTVLGNSSVKCVVTISGPAPAGGDAVSVSTNDPAITVPAWLTVPAGSSQAEFTVYAPVVNSTTAVKISAKSGDATATATLTIATTLKSLTIAPISVITPAATTGTINLTGPAPTGGERIELSSNSLKATVPPSILVPARATSASFSLSTAVVSSSTMATITATQGSSSDTASVTLFPPDPLASFDFSSANVFGGEEVSCTVRLAHPAPVAIQIALSSNNAAVPVPATVTVLAGTGSLTIQIKTKSVTSAQTAIVEAIAYGVQKDATITVHPIGIGPN